jgi:predicted PolB exonuclease-like 3'-5' exonuclease
VTFNGNSFDLPVLRYRAMINLSSTLRGCQSWGREIDNR